jgi:peptidyl-Lys metalloendopeptidase
MGKLTFDPSCNIVQQQLLGLVLEQTKLMVDRAVVRTSPMVLGGSDPDYLKWFGTFDESRAHHVYRTYQLIARALERGIECACDSKGKAYANVFPGLRRKIHLKPRFWKAPYSGLDSKPGVVVHELAHEVLRGGDFQYGTTKAARLAATFPWLAVRNADNYEYFAESI